MKRKGFTLTELLVTIVILGIISGLSMPLIRNLMSNFEKNKYKTYSSTVLAAAKLYNDSYSEDIFGRKTYGCGYITYEQLTDKDLLKDISDDKLTCNSEYTFVKVFKRRDKYSYKVFLGCKEKKNSSSEIVRYPEDTTEVIDAESCTGSLNNNIKIEVDDTEMGDKPLKQRKSTKLILSSGTGIDTDLLISVAWSKKKEGWNEVSDWKKVNFDLPKNQEAELLNGDTIVTDSNKLTTPVQVSGDYYLLVKVDNLKDLYGSEWVNKKPENGNYLSFGPFKVDNLGPKVTAEVYNCMKDPNTGNPAPTGSILTTKTVQGVTSVPTVTTGDLNGGNNDSWLNASSSPIGVCTKFKAEDESGLDYYVRGTNENELPANKSGYKEMSTISAPKDLTGATKCKDTNGNDIENCVTKNIWVKDNGHKYVVYDVYDKAGNYTSLIYDIKRDAIVPTCGEDTTTSTKVTVKCEDEGGSTCGQSSYSKDYSSGTTSVNVTIKDKANNSTSCPVKINTSAPAITMYVYKCGSDHKKSGDALAGLENKKSDFTVSITSWFKYTYGICVNYKFTSSAKIKRAILYWNKKGLTSDYKDACSGCYLHSTTSSEHYDSAIRTAHVGKTSGSYSTYLDDDGKRYLRYVLVDENDNQTEARTIVWLDREKPTIKCATSGASVKVSCDDDLSGCSSDGDQGTKYRTGTYTVYDKAGNSKSCTVTSKKVFSYCKAKSMYVPTCKGSTYKGSPVGSIYGNTDTATCKITNETRCNKAKSNGYSVTKYYVTKFYSS